MLQMPDKLLPLVLRFNEFRYFLAEGGRGGGKSQAIGRFILYLAEKYKLRVVCGREIQNSIAESVYSLMADLVLKYNLNFEVQASRIISRHSGSTINFRGFREQGAFNIQGMEGVDIVWIDESQAITKETLDVLIPTIRKDNAKIFFSMNRHVFDDPVFTTFSLRHDCLHISINYNENPFCTNALKVEAEECKKKSQSDYDHIWLGIPLALSEDAVFGHDELWSCKKVEYPVRDGYGLRIGGFDIARYGDDKCAVVTLQQMGALHWEVAHADQWDHKDLNFTTGRILQEASDQRHDKAIIDEDGIGGGPLDTLSKGRNLEMFVGFRNPNLPYLTEKFYGNNRTKNAYKLKDLILKGHIRITQEDIIKELEMSFRYTYDNYQRKVLISKEKMREKYKIKSPNLADALIMAVSLIGEINYKQDQQYVRLPQYVKEDNLFESAGVR